MSITLKEIAGRTGGKLEGDAGSVVITGMNGLADAGSGDITFLANPRYARLVENTSAAAVLVANDWSGRAACPVIRVKNPDRAFMEVAAMLAPPEPAPVAGIHASAIVAADAEIAPDASVGALCVIESRVKVGSATVISAGCHIARDTVIGSCCKLYPGVSVRERVRIGDRVIIHNGAVIGSDGFGYARDGVKWVKIPQVGTVEIGDDVEIGANVTIDRARFGKTIISDGVKIDNLVQIAHNCKVGRNTVMASQVGISGSTVIGENIQIGGQAGFAGHIEVGDNSIIGAKAGVTKSVPPAVFVSGYPAMPHDKARKIHANTMMLPKFRDQLKALENEVERLKGILKDKGIVSD